ncbi:hypothetical protein ACFV9C_42845 [Kribbella sp. NPDC059898]|uniref:hypothetical protein n=1 Tax=Kribbella sp. NPDC059898 TaxID=3346995 RepID=UPI00365BBF2A
MPDRLPGEIQIERQDGSTMLRLRCPDCGAIDSIMEVSETTRWTKVDEVWKVGDDLHIHWTTTEVDSMHTRFCCAECDATLVLAQAMYHSSDEAPDPRRIDPADLQGPSSPAALPDRSPA